MKKLKEKHKYIEDYTNTRFSMFFEEIDFNRLNFLDSLSKTIKELKKEGIKVESIAEKIYNTFEEGLERLYNQETNQVWDFMKSVSQQTIFSEMTNETKYKWTLEEGANHCKGCMDRNGQIKTFQEWEADGLPGTGLTECNENCLCDLIEVTT
jgi:hypothetical protein